MEENRSLIDRNEYLQSIQKDRAENPYDETQHRGAHNPYTGTNIEDERDYYAYRSQHVYLTLANESYDKEVKNQKRRSLVVVTALIVVIAVLLGVWVPHKIDETSDTMQAAGYNSGYAAGEKSGYDSGYAAGKNNGYDSGYTVGEKNGYDSGYAAGIAETGVETQPVAEVIPPEETATEPTPVEEIIVYVSKSGHKIHSNPTCSGMKRYYEMTYDDAVASGFDFCSNCFN